MLPVQLCSLGRLQFQEGWVDIVKEGGLQGRRPATQPQLPAYGVARPRTAAAIDVVEPDKIAIREDRSWWVGHCDEEKQKASYPFCLGGDIDLRLVCCTEVHHNVGEDLGDQCRLV